MHRKIIQQTHQVTCEVRTIDRFALQPLSNSMFTTTGKLSCHHVCSIKFEETMIFGQKKNRDRTKERAPFMRGFVYNSPRSICLATQFSNWIEYTRSRQVDVGRKAGKHFFVSVFSRFSKRLPESLDVVVCSIQFPNCAAKHIECGLLTSVFWLIHSVGFSFRLFVSFH